MAWIESHQAMENHPKRKMLSNLMKWDKYATIGKIHAFWWWCLEFAPSGDLSRWNDALLAESVGLNADEGKAFVDAMVQSGWIDRDREKGVFRVHDWVEYAGRYLRDSKFKHHPEKWKEVLKLYNKKRTKNVSRLSADNPPKISRKSAVPNLTKPKENPLPPNGASHLPPLALLWNEILGDTLPMVEEVPNSWRKKEAARLKEHSLDVWRDALLRGKKSDFLMGKVRPKNPDEQAFRWSYDWIIQNDNNVVKVLSGKYDNRPVQRELTESRLVL